MAQFRSLAQRLMPPLPPVSSMPDVTARPPATVQVPPRERVQQEPALPPQAAEVVVRFLADLIRLRARAAEALENEAERFLSEFARGVIARELESSPSDLRALLASARREFESSVLRIRIAVGDRINAPDIETIEDPALARGDLVVEVPDGTIDLRLATRLARVLESQRIELAIEAAG